MTRFLSTIGAVILGACGASAANTTIDMVKFHSSTPIMIAGTELPAGDNTIQVLDGSDGNAVLLVRSESGQQAMVLTNRLNASGIHADSAAQVTFQRRGNVYRLDRIWLDDRTGFQVLQSATE